MLDSLQHFAVDTTVYEIVHELRHTGQTSVLELLKESILGHAGRHVVSVKFCRGGVDHREDCSRRLLVHAKFHSMSARLGVYGTPKVVNVAKFENINAPESLARFLGKQISTFVCSSRASLCSKLGGIHVRD